MATTRSLYVRVGLLIIAGLVLATGFLLFLTAGRIDKQALIFETYLQESVTGLEVGAPVRYRGVRIGQVSQIGLVNAEYPPSDRNGALAAFQLVLVRMALDPDKSTIDDTADAQRAVTRGLRARLSSQGITGVAYVELDFVSVDRFPMRDLPWDPRFPVIPSMPSTISQVQNAAEALLSRIESAPIEQLTGDLAGILAAVRAQVTDGDLADTLHEASRTMAALRQVSTGTDLPGLVSDLRLTVAELRAALTGPEAQAMLGNAAAAAAELRRSLARLPAVIQTLEGTVRAARSTTQDANADLGPLLRDLRAVAANLRDTTESLRRAPGQAIFGAPPPPAPRR
jgi:paraquat-inducible protein B